MKADYTIAAHSEDAIWRAFENGAWPALYLIDALGRIRHGPIESALHNLTTGSGWQLIAASGNSDFGQICGFGINPAGHFTGTCRPRS